MKAILFDFNGTLFYDSDKHYVAWSRFLAKRGLRVPSPEEFQRDFVGTVNIDILRTYVDPDITAKQISEAVEEKENLYFEACLEDAECLRLTEGAEAFFDLLTARGIPFMLATGSDRHNMEFYFKHLPIGKWFSFERNIIYDDYSRRGKPHPDIYLAAAKHLNTPIDECVVFEDALAGYQAANSAGAGAIVMVGPPRDTQEFESLPAVTEIIRNFNHPEKLLARLGFTI